MENYSGKSIYQGIVIGKIHCFRKEKQMVARRHIDDVDAESRRYEEAIAIAMQQLSELYEKAVQDVGELNAQIFEVHKMMLEDGDYMDSVFNMIRSQKMNAEYAIATTGDNFSKMFSTMEDAYFQARAADVKDITERLLIILNGDKTSVASATEPMILVADDLAPSETIQMDKKNLLSFVTRQGSTSSHTAILARTLGIPAVIHVDYQMDWDGKLAIVDGDTGTIILEPDEEVLLKYQEKIRLEKEKKELLLQMKGRATKTQSGKEIQLYANIGNVSDLALVLANDAGGIGLFRSEFLFLDQDHLPTEEEQFYAYRQVAETMAGKKVIIRTLDLGADKQVDYFQLDPEENPAMGLRAIRICLTRPEIFKTQLRAIYRASLYGNLSIMYPMIISVEEIRQIKEIVRQVKQELKEEQIEIGVVEEGIMIETPAAVMISDLLAKEVDFFSIGTNDLTQYTLAIDRQNTKLDQFYNPYHEAILRMIELVTLNAHKENIWVGICGELGADQNLVERFVQMGIDELSVAPGCILPLRKRICEME